MPKSNKHTNIVNTARAVIYNKYILYLVFVAALFNLLYSAVNLDYLYCILFVLSGFLVSFFSKNMTVILTLTMAISTILRNVISGSGLNVEGFEESEKSEKSEDDSESVKKNATEPEENTVNKDDKDDKDNKGDKESSKKTDSKVNSASAPTPANLMNKLKENALDLQDTQKEIISGFEKIEPYMNKAESLIGSIQDTALTIQEMRNKQGFRLK